MSFFIGLDIGGSKIAGAVFDARGKEIAQHVMPTPANYAGFFTSCKKIVEMLDRGHEEKAPIGIGLAGVVNRDKGTVFASNISYLKSHPIQKDFEKAFGRDVRMANDADCAALSEATDGAGKGHSSVFCLIMGTGIGGGLVVDQKIVEGVQGLAGEFGHLPLPFREYTDGIIAPCLCKQKGCIEQSIGGSALARLYENMTGHKAGAEQVGNLARKNDPEALRVMDQFYTTVAKAMVTVIHMFDPEIIVVSGGLSNLPGLYDEVPKRWGQYALQDKLKTKFVQAKHGAISGLRGAAALWR